MFVHPQIAKYFRTIQKLRRQMTAQKLACESNIKEACIKFPFTRYLCLQDKAELVVSNEPQIIGHYFITTHFYENLAECNIYNGRINS
jgi:hypothetical protein